MATISDGLDLICVAETLGFLVTKDKQRETILYFIMYDSTSGSILHYGSIYVCLLRMFDHLREVEE